VTAIPTFAEQALDKRTVLETFRGKPFEQVTCRVLLHAADGSGRARCGQDEADLTLIGVPWDDAYLPHLPRCRACAGFSPADDAGPAADGDLPELPAANVDIRAAHGSADEIAGAEALREVLNRHDLRRWMFTDVVTVNEGIRGGFSHPLTMHPRLLLIRPESALSSFLHEQLHWLSGLDSDAATAEASERWPDPPPPPAGCEDAQSTWLHMAVCALEYQSLAKIIGTAQAEAELRKHRYYSWLYDHILADPDWYASYLDRHGLTVPGQPPVPRRYCGHDWWTDLIPPGGT